MFDLTLAGIFTDALSGAVAVLIGVTGLFGGGAHYAAVLAGRSAREVERATGIGFFLGFGLATLALVVDAIT